MSDLIDRQAAIDALYHVDEYNGRSVEAIRNLPSAQSERTEERTETHACDCIERQAAIDIVQSECRCGEQMDLIEELKALPSAQPEIIHCKDCKHFEYDHPYIIQGVPVLGHEVCNAWGDGCKTDENGYCFMAERREE